MPSGCHDGLLIVWVLSKVRTKCVMKRLEYWVGVLGELDNFKLSEIKVSQLIAPLII